MNRSERKLRNLVARGVVRRVSYRNKVRLLQVESWPGYVQDDVEHAENYGFTSHPLKDSESVVVNIAGNSSRRLVILVNDRRHRIEITEGQTAMYTANGEVIKCDNAGEISLKSASRVLLDTPLVEALQDLTVRGNAQVDGNHTVGGDADIGGNVTTDGTIDSAGDQTAGGVSQQTHVHTGVTTGTGVSGPPQP